MIKYFSGQVNGVRYIHKIYEQIQKDCKDNQFRILDSFIIPKEFEIDDMNIGEITKYEYWFMVEIIDQELTKDSGQDCNVESM